MAILPRRPKGLTRREAIDLPTTAPPLYSTEIQRFNYIIPASRLRAFA
jgi:hypothetical protein